VKTRRTIGTNASKGSVFRFGSNAGLSYFSQKVDDVGHWIAARAITALCKRLALDRVLAGTALGR